MKQRKYFDCFAAFGRPSIPDKDYPYDVETLISDMAYSRVHAVAAVHNASIDYSFSYGNRLGLEIAKKNERIYSLSAVVSGSDYETCNQNYFKDLLNNGSVGFVILAHRFFKATLEPLSVKKMVEPLLEHKKPLVICDTYSDDFYGKIDALAKCYPELPIILQGTFWRYDRSLFDIMDKHDNLYFDICVNHTNNVIEFTKNNFGINRVLYSCSWPYHSMPAIKATVEYADITEEEKDLVAHGNACSLFGIDKESLALYDDNDCRFDEIAREADEGKPISFPVIDPHSHIVDDYKAVNDCVMFGGDCKTLYEKMSRLGIDTTITAPWVGLQYDGIKGNEEAIKANSAIPSGFLAYSCCNVNYPEQIEQTIKYHEKYPDVFVGIKPYPPYQKFDLKDEVCTPWFEYADKHNLIALIHADSPEYAEAVDVLSVRYPNITFILAHSGASYAIARKNSEVAKKHDNVVLDITYTSTARGMVEFLVNEVGADKVLFATDMPMRDPAPQLGWVCYADIPLEDKKKILAENIISIMKRRK